MDVKESELLRDGADTHWYYRNKLRAVRRLLDGRHFARVLDVGAGSGFFSRHLLTQGIADAAWCVDINYPDDHDEVENGKSIHFRRALSAVDADLVLLMDVLEHVDDDADLLRQSIASSASNGTFLISVPAFQFLWSGHDVFLEHRRRYTLRALERVVTACGLRVVRGCYFYANVFPLAALMRLSERLGKQAPVQSALRPHAPVTNAALSGLVAAELPWFRFNRLFGLTAFCVAQRV